jgi:hypothetical protein
MEYSVSLSPAPDRTLIEVPTAFLTTRMISSFSEDLVVGASPVVPLTTIPSWPFATR